MNGLDDVYYIPSFTYLTPPPKKNGQCEYHFQIIFFLINFVRNLHSHY